MHRTNGAADRLETLCKRTDVPMTANGNVDCPDCLTIIMEEMDEEWRAGIR